MPYLGFCHTADHAQALEAACVNVISRCMQDPKDSMCEAELGKLTNADATTKPDAEDTAAKADPEKTKKPPATTPK
eukprot:1635935-Alexandrium_andersonii.AAC.1